MKKRYLLYIHFISALVNTGCSKFVELATPKSLVVTEAVFEDNVTATTALTGIYFQMHDKELLPLKLSVYTGLYGDEIYSRFGSYTNIYQNDLPSVNALTNEIWTACYSYIYQANAIYEGCERSDKLTMPVKRQLMAEARFIRAFCYFYLVNLYGDVPLALTTDYQINSVLARKPKAEIYSQMINDLRYAQNELNSNYIGANSESAVADRIRPNKSAATALLARIELFNGNWAEAEAQVTTVITDANYVLETVQRVFLKTSKEAIWQLTKPTPIGNTMTWEGNSYVLGNLPVSNTSIQSYTLEKNIMEAFESGDLRRSNWVGKATGGNFFYPNKYKVQITSATDATECTTPIRLAEMYLIRAEARIQQNRIAEGITDLNTLRNRATDTSIPILTRLPQLSTSLSKEDALTAVLHERQVELFTEWGHRWLDLKRTGKVNTVMTTVTAAKGGTWQPYKLLWPIPDKDLATDVNLKQNEGYN